MLADALAGESPAGAAFPEGTVVISAAWKGDRPGESADVNVPVGCVEDPFSPRSDPPGGQANWQAVAKVSDHSEPGTHEKVFPPEADGGVSSAPRRRQRPSGNTDAKVVSVGEEGLGACNRRRSGGVEDGMSGKDGQRKHGTTRGSPRRSRTAKASRITGSAGKSRRAREWGGWGRLSVDGPGQNNPDRSEGPWGRTAKAVRMAVSNRATCPTLSGTTGKATDDTNGERKPHDATGMPGAGLTEAFGWEGTVGKASLGAVPGKTRRTES
jgi:hypothetical protein